MESNVSVFERHFNKGRPVKESTMEDEMEVTMNGPILVEADPVIETSMNRYWNGKRWHFTKKWDIRDHLKNTASLVLKRMKKERSSTIHGQMACNMINISLLIVKQHLLNKSTVKYSP